MKNIVITIAFMLTLPIIVCGQNQILQKINEIKFQKDIYIWSQYAHPDADSARINAARWLLIEAQSYRSESDELTLESISDKIKHIKMEQGGIIRDFAYIAKAEIRNLSPSESPRSPLVTNVQDKFVSDLFVQKIVEQKSFQAVYNYLRDQKTVGTILQFGSLKDVEDYSSFDLILFDLKSKNVISMLSGTVSGGERINLMTGMPDSLESYPKEMIAVIWYIKL